MALGGVPSLFQLLVFSVILVLQAKSLNFVFDEFQFYSTLINFEGDASVCGNILQLTKNDSQSIGHAAYYRAIHLWDNATGGMADWETSFDFVIEAQNKSHGDGFSFFLAPQDFRIPPDDCAGGFLGLFPSYSAFYASQNQAVAIEMDTYQNEWDPSSKHVGINVNSINSVAAIPLTDINDLQFKARARIVYNSISKELKAILSVGQKVATLSYNIDLSTVLPEFVKVGFSGATGSFVETHKVVSWNFWSSLLRNPASLSSTGLSPVLILE